MSTTGRVVSINISPGGVPKRPVAEVRVTLAGIEETGRRTVGITEAPLVVPGCHMALGDDVEVEITAFAPPCRTIRHSFLEERFSGGGRSAAAVD